jgi:hypothetical protein
MNPRKLHRELNTLEHALSDLSPDQREPIDLALNRIVGALLDKTAECQRLQGAENTLKALLHLASVRGVRLVDDVRKLAACPNPDGNIDRPSRRTLPAEGLASLLRKTG